jgi:hypothetical protein
MKIIGSLLVVAVLIVIGLIVADVASPPAVTQGQCLLARRIILPDICVNSCKQVFDCTATTRPYAIFFTQAASCVDAVICE